MAVPAEELGKNFDHVKRNQPVRCHLEIVSFHLGEQEFCIDIMAIREIRGWAPVTPMPHTPPYVSASSTCAAR
jgi:chemotaxis signal transduction protein